MSYIFVQCPIGLMYHYALALLKIFIPVHISIPVMSHSQTNGFCKFTQLVGVPHLINLISKTPLYFLKVHPLDLSFSSLLSNHSRIISYCLQKPQQLDTSKDNSKTISNLNYAFQ